jgi:hypothetical protein
MGKRNARVGELVLIEKYVWGSSREECEWGPLWGIVGGEVDSSGFEFELFHGNIGEHTSGDWLVYSGEDKWRVPRKIPDDIWAAYVARQLGVGE